VEAVWNYSKPRAEVFFTFSPFLLASARIFISKQIMPPLRGEKVVFFHFMLKYAFFKKSVKL